MNLNEIHELWNSNRNELAGPGREKIVKEFTARLARMRKQEVGWLIWTFFVLTVLTIFAGWQIFGTSKVHLASEWATIPLLLIPWVFALIFLRRYLRGLPPEARARGDVSIAESVRAAMKMNKESRLKLKLVGWMYLVVVPVLALGMSQLHEAGKLADRERVSMAIFLYGVLAVCAAAVLAKYWIRLVPEGKKLESINRQLGTVGE